MHHKHRTRVSTQGDIRKRASKKCAQAARWFVLGGTLFSPWLFGCAEGWAYLLLALVFHGALVLWLVSMMLAPPPGDELKVLYVPLLLMTAFVILQIVPMPGFVVHALSPLSWKIQTAGCAVVEEVSLGAVDSGVAPACSPLTWGVSPWRSLRSFFLMTSYFSAFVILASWRAHRREIRKVAVIFMLSGFLLALFGMLQAFAGAREIYGFHSPRHGGNFFGSFSNRNHFAFQMNLLFGLAMSLLLSGRTTYGFWGLDGWRKRVAWLSTSDGSRMLLSGLCAMMIGSAVFLSLSRAGVASLLGALGLVGVSFGVHARIPKRSRIITALVLLLILCSVVWLGWDEVIGRLGTLKEVASDPVGDTRFKAARDAFRAFLRFPVVGAGLGTFQHVFPLVQSPDIQFGRWLHAHNDWVELLVDLGLVGSVIGIWLLARLVAVIRRTYRRAERDSVLFANGLLLALCAACIHSVWDYSLHKPANAATLALLLGLMIASLRERSGSRGHSRHLINPAMNLRVRGCLLLMVVLALASMCMQLAVLRSEVAFARYYRVGRLVERLSDRPEVSDAAGTASMEAGHVVQIAGADPEVLLEVAVSNIRWLRYRRIKPLIRIKLAEQAVDAAARATVYAPSNYLHWFWWARAESFMGRRESAELLIQRAQEIAPPGVDLELR